jgi:hypothetical protein
MCMIVAQNFNSPVFRELLDLCKQPQQIPEPLKDDVILLLQQHLFVTNSPIPITPTATLFLDKTTHLLNEIKSFTNNQTQQNYHPERTTHCD